MRLPGRNRTPRSGDAEEAITRASAAQAAACERLASASDMRSAAAALAAHEDRTVIQGLRDIRKRNHLADLILDSVERKRP
jgi:hypothetical protein